MNLWLKTEQSLIFNFFSFIKEMTISKEQQILQRRARIRQLQEEGRVMTDSMRKKIKEESKRQQKLQDMADLILVQSNRVSKVPMGTVTNIVEKSSAPSANVLLKNKTKVDLLSVAANEIIKELQSA
jgi:hypothetical protein